MFNFQFYNPTQMIFGPGTAAQIGSLVQPFGPEVLLLMGRGHARRNGSADRVLATLKEAGVRVRILEGVEPNPLVDSIEAMVRDLQGYLPHVIIAMGGGSVMDAGRLLSLALTHEGPLWEYALVGPRSLPGIQNRLIPVITMATLTGNGTEISPAAMALHNQRKEVYYSPLMAPKIAIVDPELSRTLPRDLTLQSGLDGFVQALEAFVSTTAQPFSDTYASRAIQLAFHALPRLANDLEDVALRSEIALAGILSIYAVTTSGLGAVHALSDPLSGHYNISHGLALGMLLPGVMRANLEGNPAKFAALAGLLGCNIQGISPEAAGMLAVETVEDWLDRLGFTRYRLSEFGVQEAELAVFAAEAENPAMATNPRPLVLEERVTLYRRIL